MCLLIQVHPRSLLCDFELEGEGRREGLTLSFSKQKGHLGGIPCITTYQPRCCVGAGELGHDDVPLDAQNSPAALELCPHGELAHLLLVHIDEKDILLDIVMETSSY